MSDCLTESSCRNTKGIVSCQNVSRFCTVVNTVHEVTNENHYFSWTKQFWRGKKNSGAGLGCWNGTKFTIKKTHWPNLEGAFFVNSSKLVRFVQLQSKAKWNPPKHVYYNLKRMVKVGGQWRSSNPPVFGQMARYKEWMFAKAD